MCLLNPQLRGELYCSDEAWHETGWEQPDVLGVVQETQKCPACNAAELT